jgi:hypothetical protein
VPWQPKPCHSLIDISSTRHHLVAGTFFSVILRYTIEWIIFWLHSHSLEWRGAR